MSSLRIGVGGRQEEGGRERHTRGRKTLGGGGRVDEGEKKKS